MSVKIPEVPNTTWRPVAETTIIFNSDARIRIVEEKGENGLVDHAAWIAQVVDLDADELAQAEADLFLSAIKDHMSIHSLDVLIATLQRERDRQEARRQEFIAQRK